MNIYNVKFVKDEDFFTCTVIAPNERTAKKRFNTLKKDFDVIVKIVCESNLYDSLVEHGYDEKTAKLIANAK